MGENVKAIGSYAFYGCESLTTVIMGDSVTSIGESAFSGCDNLTTVTMGDGVKTIGESAFARSTKLEDVVLGDSVATIKQFAFSECDSLSSVSLPATVTTVGNSVFKHCDNLTSVTFLGDVPASVGSNIFASCSRDLAVHYHEGTTGWPETGSWQDVTLVMDPHTVVTDAAVAPTCAEAGLTEGSHCSVCEKVLTMQEAVPATGTHGFQMDEAVAATCTESGLTVGASCPTCGFVHLAQEVVPATGHTEVAAEAVAATCTDTGLTAGSYCSACGETLSGRDVLPKTSHAIVIDQSVAPTCTEVGYSGTGMHCSACGEVLVARTEAPALGHDYIDHEGQEPTVDSVGWEAYQTCSRCDYSTYKELPALSKPTGTIAGNGRTLSLEGEIYINQYILVTGFEGIDLTTKGGLLVWDHKVTEEAAVYGSQTYVNEGMVYNITTANGVPEYMVRTNGIAAKEYADEVYFRVYVEVAPGEYVYGELAEYSVQTYCQNQLNKSGTSAVQKQVCAQMLHYGAAAQKRFNYHVTDLANANILGSYPAPDWMK